MKVVQTTEAHSAALASIVDKAYGYPRAGVLGPSLVNRPIQQTWDGNGGAPFGWTRTQCVEWYASASDVWLQIEDDTLATALSSGRLTGGEAAQLGSATRVTVADAGPRNPKESAAPNEAATEAKQ